MQMIVNLPYSIYSVATTEARLTDQKQQRNAAETSNPLFASRIWCVPPRPRPKTANISVI
jgi:hypothetical protein